MTTLAVMSRVAYASMVEEDDMKTWSVFVLMLAAAIGNAQLPSPAPTKLFEVKLKSRFYRPDGILPVSKEQVYLWIYAPQQGIAVLEFHDLRKGKTVQIDVEDEINRTLGYAEYISRKLIDVICDMKGGVYVLYRVFLPEDKTESTKQKMLHKLMGMVISEGVVDRERTRSFNAGLAQLETLISPEAVGGIRPLQENVIAVITPHKVIYLEIGQPVDRWHMVSIPPPPPDLLIIDYSGKLWGIRYQSEKALAIHSVGGDRATLTLTQSPGILYHADYIGRGSARFLREDDGTIVVEPDLGPPLLTVHGRWLLASYLEEKERISLHTYKEKYLENIYSTYHIVRAGRLGEYDSKGRLVRWVMDIEAIMPDEWKNLPDNEKYSYFAPWNVDLQGNVYFTKHFPDRTEIWIVPVAPLSTGEKGVPDSIANGTLRN